MNLLIDLTRKDIRDEDFPKNHGLDPSDDGQRPMMALLPSDAAANGVVIGGKTVQKAVDVGARGRMT